MNILQEELNMVKRAIEKQTKAKYYKGYQSVYLHLSGMTYAKIANIVGYIIEL